MKRMTLAFATAAIALAGCSSGSGSEDAPATQASSRTLASLLADARQFSIVAGTMRDSGLSEVFDGNASYTVFVPTDDAFATLGASAALLEGEEQRAAMVAVLRDHIVPGTFTPEDISNAIDVAGGDAVTMASVGGHELTFTRDGDVIGVSNSDGSTGRLAGEALQGANGVLIPIDSVLKDLSSAGG